MPAITTVAFQCDGCLKASLGTGDIIEFSMEGKFRVPDEAPAPYWQREFGCGYVILCRACVKSLVDTLQGTLRWLSQGDRPDLPDVLKQLEKAAPSGI